MRVSQPGKVRTAYLFRALPGMTLPLNWRLWGTAYLKPSARYGWGAYSIAPIAAVRVRLISFQRCDMNCSPLFLRHLSSHLPFSIDDLKGMIFMPPFYAIDGKIGTIDRENL